MEDSAPKKNADKKARVFDLDAMFAQTLSNAPKSEHLEQSSSSFPKTTSESGLSSSAASDDDDGEFT